MSGYLTAGLCALTLTVVFAIGGVGYHLGEGRTNDQWQAKWESHLADDATATAKAQAEERAKEKARQATINQVTTHAQEQIDHATADAAGAIAAAGSLRETIDSAISRLADSQERVSACTTNASKAAASAARVLADVLKRVDARAGDLAAAADQSRVRGLACEAAYDGLDSK